MIRAGELKGIHRCAINLERLRKNFAAAFVLDPQALYVSYGGDARLSAFVIMEIPLPGSRVASAEVVELADTPS